VNFADLAARAGVYGPAPRPPFAPGFEVSGVITEADPATGFVAGERVLSVTRFGGYTTELVTDAVRVRRLPAEMTLEEAAALPAQWLTAWHALTELCRVRKGESVLIHAAAGGVGTAAVQLCRELGLVSYGTASTAEKIAYAKEQGLVHGIVAGEEDWAEAVARLTGGRGVDVVLDANGGGSFARSFQCLAPGGKLVVFGAAAAMPRSLRALGDLPKTAMELARQKRFGAFELIEKNASVMGLQILLLWDRIELLGQELDSLLFLRQTGRIRPVIDRVFPLGDAADAHRYLHARLTRGKVLLRGEP
jgi:NADPH:quinone reductase-like Zn-dependent oxidoreductase